MKELYEIVVPLHSVCSWRGFVGGILQDARTCLVRLQLYVRRKFLEI